MLILRKPWDSQPQEVVGLNFQGFGRPPASVLTMAGGALLERVTTAAPSDSATGVSTQVAAVGRVKRYDGSAGFTTHTRPSSITATSAWTCVMHTRFIGTLGLTGIFNLGDAGIAYWWSTSGMIFATENASSAYAVQLSSNPGVDKWHRWVFRCLGDTIRPEIWCDGVNLSANGTAGLTLGVAAYEIGRGNGSYYSNMECESSILFDYALSEAEIAEISRSPDGVWAATFAPRSIWIPVSAGGGGISGTLATTNANDTSAASGTTTVLGTLARTNASDTSAASGTTTILGTVAATNGDDTAAASGTVGSSGSTGTVNYTNANDTAAATGTTTVIGTVAKSNADDSVSASGWVGAITGTLAYTNADDTLSASGTAAGPAQAAPVGGGGYLPSFRRKTRKEIHAERVRLGILPEQIKKAAEKVVEKAAEQGDPQEVYEDNTEKYKAMFLREVGATKWAPDYARAIRIQLELMERDAEDALLLM